MEFSHDCGSGGRDQFKWECRPGESGYPEEFPGWPVAGNGYSPWEERKVPCAVDQARKIDSLDLERFKADAAENDIDDRVECADLMKLHFLDGSSVNL